MPRILIVEDDPSLSRILDDSLKLEGFETRATANGNAALNLATSFAPDLVLLDIGLPGKDGLELCRIWREGPRLPVIMLTARSQQKDKLRGLSSGADDYITKPFDLQELIARIWAVLRRSRPRITTLQLGDIVVDFEHHRASHGDTMLDLSHREFAILRYLAERPESVVPRDELLQAIWGYPEQPLTRSVDHAIARLRRKIETDPHHPRFIHSAYAGGYSMSIRGQ